ncbi:cyclohexanone monooxygenase [Oleiphilus messinensis]|uniref:Cyclohexanone monooxygenase n=1 Tax=Oleiphilus messinensis TaxID=141451 RepID=A0A1Y0IGP0_9GAMM|nr:NAD(P)/FAD-dependent oxidoreductase [Oleiphilus messinensis]ARU58996.1 cyclohexanone monooxygenase [Oleiphilus messinensis]
MTNTHVDVLIVGAGVSGIGMACHLTRNCPDKTYTILERRDAIGGTWDLFRYPGIRSDSDMFTFGYHFKPWTGAKVLADGASIKGYVQETAQEYGVDRHIQYGLKVIKANWSNELKYWTVTVAHEASGDVQEYTANFVVGCTGYYNYDQGYKPDFPGEADFKGQVIHPQHWPQGLDYTGKKVVVIGSGATAVTIVPSMADKAAMVTMLQRSPTYMMPVPVIDPVTRQLQKLLPDKLVYRITRARNIAIQKMIFQESRKRPKVMRRFLLSLVRRQLGSGADMRHFTPHYNPWDERLCAVADGDLFKAIRKGKVTMATDQIERFTAGGIQLKSGKQLEADIIITATGLDLQMLGGINLQIDEEPVDFPSTMVYKNVLVEGIPNAGMIFGYTNLPWTLKADIASEYLCRLIKYMDANGYRQVVPVDQDNCKTESTMLTALNSGYVKRAQDRLPRQGSKAPWTVSQDYHQDSEDLRKAPIADGILTFDGFQKSGRARPATGIIGRLKSVLNPG